MCLAVDFTAIFKAQDKVSNTLKGIDKSGDALTNTFKKLAKAAAGVFTVAKIAEFGKESVDAFTSFENSMNEVFTLLPDISGEAMEEMTGQVKALSKEMGILPNEAVPALYQALSAGVPQDTVFDFLKVANKAAVGGVTTLETAVDGLTSVVNAYGSDVIDVNKASDLMFTTVKLGKTNFEELSASLFNVNPTAAATGVAFEDVSAALAAMTAQGVPTSVATTQLRQALVELSKSGTSTDKVFRRVAGKGFKEFISEGGNLQEAFQLLEKHAQKSGLGVNDLFGSVEAGNAVLALTGKGTERFTNAMEEMRKATGATDAAFQKMEKGFKRKLDKMKANLEVLKISVGGKLVDAFNWLWDKASPVVDGISKGFEKIKNLFNDYGFSGAIEKMFGADAGELAKKAKDYATAYIGGIKKIFSGDIEGGFTDILAALGFDDGSISTIMDFVDSIKSNLMKLSSFVQPIFATIKNAFFSIMPTVQNIINFFTQTLLPIVQDVFSFIVDNVITPFVGYWQENMPKIANIFNNVWLILQPIFLAIADAFRFVWSIAKPIIANIVDLVTGLGSAIFTILDGIIEFIAGVFTGDWEKAWSGVIKIFNGIWDGIVAIFKFPINMIIDGLNFFLRGLNKIKIPDWVPGIGGKGLNIPEIPKLAKGSKDAPDTFIAGERGPELITGAEGARVFPSDDTERIISALEKRNAPLVVSANPFSGGYDDEPISDEKTININLNGQGTIKGNGISKDEMLEYLIVHLKPILMKIIETEIFEEGDLAYEY